MKVKFLIFLCVMLFCNVQMKAQDLNLTWAKRIGGQQIDTGLSVALDANGNIYTTGGFEGTVDFDPNAGVANLMSVGSPPNVTRDVFVSKTDANGNFLWAKAMGGNGYDEGSKIILDANGNIYITGTFQTTGDFDPGAGVFNLTTVTTGFDPPRTNFITKLDANGDFVWAKAFELTHSNNITLDASGNIYVTGRFQGTVDFDPNIGVTTLTSTGLYDAFILKLGGNGTFTWVKALNGTDDVGGYALAVDATGNIYTTGQFLGTVDFDPNVGVANLTANTTSYNDFTVKLDISGNFLWVKPLGGANIILDVVNNIYTIGNKLLKLNADGDILLEKNVSSGAFAVDIAQNIYITGSFLSTRDFDPSTNVFNLTSSGGEDIFVCKLDFNGDFIWAKAMGGTSNDSGLSIAVDANKNIYMTGVFKGNVDFDPNAGITTLASMGIYDVFIAKYFQCDALSFINTVATNGTVSIPYNLDVSATNATFYAISPALPAGLTLNTSTGVISGTPTIKKAITTYEVTTSQKSGCNSVSQSYTFAIAANPAVTALDNTLSNLVKITPNPSNKDFNIDFGGINMSKSLVYVYDIQGKQVFCSDKNSNLMTISLERFTNGIYLLDVQTTEGRIIKRLAKY